MRRAAIYLRVSTQDQTTDNQERELRAAAERIGCEVAVYRDHGVSGAKGRDKRPEFDRLCKDAARRQFHMVMAWSVDRLGRSLQDLIGLLSEIHALGVDLYLHQQGIDTTTPAGKAMFQMMGVFAELERAMIQERERAGLRRAKATGTKSGKPCGRPKVEASMEAAIKAALAAGDIGIRKVAAEFGVGVSARCCGLGLKWLSFPLKETRTGRAHGIDHQRDPETHSSLRSSFPRSAGKPWHAAPCRVRSSAAVIVMIGTDRIASTQARAPGRISGRGLTAL